jgi:hypothetical protein
MRILFLLFSTIWLLLLLNNNNIHVIVIASNNDLEKDKLLLYTPKTQDFLDQLCTNGTWISSPTTFPYYFPYESVSEEEWAKHACPIAVTAHVGPQTNCYYHANGMKSGREIEDRIFQSSGPHQCKQSDPTGWLQLLRNKRVLLIGDSCPRQIWDALVIELWRGTPGEIVNPGKTIYYPAYNITLHAEVLRYGRYAGDLLHSQNSFDIAVVAFGLHFNEYPGKPARDIDRFDFETELVKLANDIEAIVANPTSSLTQIFAMETFPQHFHGMENGYFQGTFRPTSCSPLDETSLTRYNATDWRSLALDKVLKPRNIPILRISKALVSQWDAHIVEDCTHYCITSAVFRHILNVMYNGLLLFANNSDAL